MMKKIDMFPFFNNALKTASAVAALTVVSVGSFAYGNHAAAQGSVTGRPTLIISDQPLPESLRSTIYSSPRQTRTITAQDLRSNMRQPVDTIAARQIEDLRQELFSLQSTVGDLSRDVLALENEGRALSLDYYAAVATINTQLQAGTTPGNPRLIQKLDVAQTNLDRFSSTIASLNDLAVRIAAGATASSFLLENARATYSLSGAVEEDHVELAQVEDAINNLVVVVDRLLNNVNDDITRTTAYVNSEQNNLRVLATAVANGDLYGKSLANHPFSSLSFAQSANVQPVSFSAPAAPIASAPMVSQAQPIALRPAAPRPLVKIRFDRANVDYDQALYSALTQALDRFPEARFNLVAVHPNNGNAAQVAIESTRARRNAERVLRSMTQFGLPLDRVDLSYEAGSQASTSEVHVFVK